MFLRILRLQNCSKDSHFSKGQEINTSDSGFKPLKDSHASMWLISEVFTKKNYRQHLVAIRIKFTNPSCLYPTLEFLPSPTPSPAIPPKDVRKICSPLIHIYTF